MPHENERDDFWDIDKLVPKKKSTLSPFAEQIVLAEHKIDGDTATTTGENKITQKFDVANETASFSYTPSALGLIKRVTVTRLIDKYDFYSAFRSAAEIYYDFKSDKCDFVQYYSYMPQYSQLTPSQKSYYFYWRDCVRHGEYIKSDYSYIYLFAYEILNLPEKIIPTEALKLLCAVWRAYRGALPRIDSYFAVWVQDFCLLNNLECPRDLVGDFIFDIIGSVEFREFYLSDADVFNDSCIDALCAYLSDYDWRRGRYCGGDRKSEYEQYMREAMKRIFFRLKEDGIIDGDFDTATTRRNAFPSALCTQAIKCRFEIEYVPLSRNAQIREIVTESIRYVENKIRALYGVKSRLAIRCLDEKYKITVDSYFDAMIARERAKAVKASAPEYERLYDAPTEALSFEGADMIERSSWSTTVRLVPEDEIEFASPEVADMQDSMTEGGSIPSSDAAILYRILNGDTNIDDSDAERINELFYDILGDVVLERVDEGYMIIDDYREEVEKCLPK